MACVAQAPIDAIANAARTALLGYGDIQHLGVGDQLCAPRKNRGVLAKNATVKTKIAVAS